MLLSCNNKQPQLSKILTQNLWLLFIYEKNQPTASPNTLDLLVGWQHEFEIKLQVAWSSQLSILCLWNEIYLLH